MNNPSQGLQAPLQNHVHLISGHRFPIIASLDLAQALIYLLDAPTIVKTIAPMSWTYVQSPPDGTLWLEWLPPTRMETQTFSSDGYIWADAESTFRHDYKGYTIEVLKHTMGYRMNYDQMASHARTRFHIVAKNPSVNAAPPDPALWIVHYHQADRILPASQAPFPPQMQQIMQERKWLESQGKLEKRDFMLHDRQSWPQITVPASNGRGQGGMQQQGMYGQPGPSQLQQQGRGQPAYYPQQVAGGQPPAAKRQRPNPPVAGGSHDGGVHDVNIEEEENTTQGDFFDHLTTRDISMARYTQHHRWMEEVFSSPYASNQIVPADLGLGLMGELKGLTEGILEPPLVADVVGRPTKPTEAQPFTNLSQDQVAEFNRRVARHLEEGKAEIERMKAEHEAKMSAWKRLGGVMKAEKRLRLATWEGHESAVPVFRSEGDGANAEGGGEGETVQSLVLEVEELLGMKIAPRKEAVVVEKGGLERQEEREVSTIPHMGLQFQQQQQQQYGGQQQTMTANSGGTQEPTMYHQDPSAMTTMQHGLQQGLEAQRRILAGQPSLTQPLKPVAVPTGAPTAEVSNTSMMGGVDVAGTSNVDFGTTDTVPATGTSIQQQPPPTSTEGMAQPQLVVPDITLPPTTNDTDMALADHDDNTAGEAGMADDSLFNESMFGDLTNTGEGDGEGDGAGGEFDFAASSTAGGGGMAGVGGMVGAGEGEGEAFGEGMFGMSAGVGGEGGEGQ
ncbi:hypothetical protein LTR56_019184 [Elasticomyces elasticus]|nr:hypothetical protein LTR22_023701 [Elasticomyces elasticus]KAK3627498.1 hypothetical protein LTR56_019184 [Elasticomyces elasticus]KAK4917207.1 hypothetical protein LTR49_014828 [Elasticomyces elasticus]KAK5746726.1 hypothetical protein LTS12_022664 [Elasticomyces elasticus]